MKRLFSTIWEIAEVVVIATVTVFVIRTYLVQPFLVSGASMEPNFSDGNYLLIDEITYRFREPARGEVVVFRYPLDRSLFFIKRIIGIPGERIVAAGGIIKVFGAEGEMVLSESYLQSGISLSDSFDVRLGDDQYFVLGDNRYHSFDSRNWGAIQRPDIVGLTRLRVLPVSEFGTIEAPSY